MEDKITISSVDEGENVARRIIKMLEGKVCDVISFHTAHYNDLTVIEEACLGETKLLISKGLIKIPLYPRRSICFDVREKPQVIFVSERRVDIVRTLSPRDTVTRIILINHGTQTKGASQCQSVV